VVVVVEAKEARKLDGGIGIALRILDALEREKGLGPSMTVFGALR
jgi:hypothetical protein